MLTMENFLLWRPLFPSVTLCCVTWVVAFVKTQAVSCHLRLVLLVFTLVPLCPYPLRALPSRQYSVAVRPGTCLFSRSLNIWLTSASTSLFLLNVCMNCWVLILVMWRCRRRVISPQSQLTEILLMNGGVVPSLLATAHNFVVLRSGKH